MINAVVTKFGLARMPFGRDLPPSRLHRHRDCGEAAARITWAVADKTICMVTGEVGTGKTVAIRAAVADLDPASHTVIYVGNPSTGVRGILAHVVTALGGKPVHGTAALAVQAWNVLAGEAAERGRTPVLVIDEAHLLDHDQLESIRLMTTPRSGRPALAQGGPCPPGAARERNTVVPLSSSPGSPMAKTSIRPLWPGEAVNA